MELNLDAQDLGRSEIDFAGDLDLELGEGFPASVHLAGRLVVQNLEGRLLVDGQLEARGMTACGRCLRDFELQWDVPIAMMVLRDAGSEDDEGDILLIHQRQGVVDLREPFRECAILHYPQSPVCRADCRGLCPSCGVDRNHETCDCRSDDYDPRWEGLPD